MIKIEPFTFAGLPSRVIFGSGTLAQVGAEIARLGRKRALVLSTPNQRAEAEALASRLGDVAAGVFAEAAIHTPLEVTERALAAFKASGADCVVALGGGSTTGLGKAIATRTGADQVVIPTTYAGSEMTDILATELLAYGRSQVTYQGEKCSTATQASRDAGLGFPRTRDQCRKIRRPLGVNRPRAE